VAKVGKKTKKKKHPGVQFAAGNKAAVGHGRPTLTKEQKALRLTTRTQITTLISQYSALSLKEIKALLVQEDLPVIDIAILKSMSIGAKDGSMTRADWILDHIAGKPVETKNVNINSSENIDLKKLSKKQLLALKEMWETHDAS